MTTPEPLLEMTLQEKEWAQDAYRTLIELHPMGYAVKHALDILLRVEAGRRQALYWMNRSVFQKGTILCPEEKYNWTDTDWLAEVEREVKGGE